MTANQWLIAGLICALVGTTALMFLGNKVFQKFPVEMSWITCKNALSPSCEWKFQKYVGSPFERLWESNVRRWEGNPCANFSRHRDNAASWALFSHASLSSRPPLQPPESVFSYFSYQRACDVKESRIFIEPFAVITRHPLLCESPSYLVDKSYLYIDWSASDQMRESSPDAKAYYFDVGASSFKSGPGGPSQEWIVSRYSERGVNFTRIYAWEAAGMDPSQIFTEIPGHLHHLYHWYNFPASADPKSERNPLNIMQQVAREEDYVVLKVDIDHSVTENALVDQLVSRGLYKFVDDMFYEHHVNVTQMIPAWGEIQNYTLKDSYGLFLDLRRLGVRMHAWV